MTERDDPFASGGMYDTDTVTPRDRFRCFMQGHDVESFGSFSGWCHRCKHGVLNSGTRRRVFYHGKGHAYPPKHDPYLRNLPPEQREARVDSAYAFFGLSRPSDPWVDYPGADG